MKPMELMEALGDAPDDLVNAALSDTPIAERKRSHIWMSHAIAAAALTACCVLAVGAVHLMGKFGGETVQTAENSADDLTEQPVQSVSGTAGGNAAQTDDSAAQTALPSETGTAYTEIEPTADTRFAANRTDITVMTNQRGEIVTTTTYPTTADPQHPTEPVKAANGTQTAAVTIFTTQTAYPHTTTAAQPIPVRQISDAPVTVWHDTYNNRNETEQINDAITLPALPDFKFIWADNGGWGDSIRIEKNGREIAAISGLPVLSAFFTDLTGDGSPELVAGVAFGSGMVDMHIHVFDCKTETEYTLWDRGLYDYILAAENGELKVRRFDNAKWDSRMPPTGKLAIQDGKLVFAENGILPEPDKTPVTQYDGAAWKWFENPRDGESNRLRLSAYPDILFVYEANTLYYEKNGSKCVCGSSLYNVHFADITGDGVPELCQTRHGAQRYEISVMDITADKNYSRIGFYEGSSYVLFAEDGELFASATSDVSAWDPTALKGTKCRLLIRNGELCAVGNGSLPYANAFVNALYTGDVTREKAAQYGMYTEVSRCKMDVATAHEQVEQYINVLGRHYGDYKLPAAGDAVFLTTTLERYRNTELRITDVRAADGMIYVIAERRQPTNPIEQLTEFELHVTIPLEDYHGEDVVLMVKDIVQTNGEICTAYCAGSTNTALDDVQVLRSKAELDDLLRRTGVTLPQGYDKGFFETSTILAAAVPRLSDYEELHTESVTFSGGTLTWNIRQTESVFSGTGKTAYSLQFLVIPNSIGSAAVKLNMLSPVRMF